MKIFVAIADASCRGFTGLLLRVDVSLRLSVLHARHCCDAQPLIDILCRISKLVKDVGGVLLTSWRLSNTGNAARSIAARLYPIGIVNLV